MPSMTGAKNATRPGRCWTDSACEALYGALEGKGLSVLYDDRDARAGDKFATMDLIGLPWRITAGPRGLAANTVELTSRRSGETETLAPAEAVERLAAIYAPHKAQALPGAIG